MFIYKITNKTDGKFYIGQTIKSIDYRFRKHKELALRGGGYKLHAAIKKHGVDNFSVELVEECSSEDELNDREIFWIDELRPHYNLCVGGSIRLSQESIDKMANSLRGKKQTEETIQKRFTTMRSLEQDPDFLKERGKRISKGKMKTYTVEGRTYTGLSELAAAYGIKRATAGYRIRNNYKHWGEPLD